MNYTCIQILENDLIEDFYEIEKDSYQEPNENYLNSKIALPIDPNSFSLKIPMGEISYFKNKKIYYKVETGFSSAGAPIIFINKKNFKVIRIHKVKSKQDKLGIYMKYIIDDINKYIKFNQ